MHRTEHVWKGKEMQIKIYHCDDRYGPIISIKEVFKFDISETEISPKPNHIEILEWCFGAFNAGSGMERMDYFLAGNRSLCVADVIVLDEVAFMCRNIGWAPFPTEELVKAIEEGKK